MAKTLTLGPPWGFDYGNIEDAVRRLIHAVGEDPNRDGLKETPRRVAGAMSDLLGGYGVKVEAILKQFDNDENYDEMVIVKDVDFTSLCEHHLLPFQGVAHVGYIPLAKIVGLSKLARLVDVFSKRLQVQERMTKQIVNAIAEHLKPVGAGCVVEARHQCLACRGAKKPNAVMITSALYGTFKDDVIARSEFLELIRSK